MTVTYAGNGLYTGLSTDTKPTVQSGNRFYETDTGDESISDGTFWWIKGRPGPFSKKKIGMLPAGTSGTNGDGLFQTMTAATGVGSQTFLSDTTNGSSLTCISGTTSGNKGGFYLNSARFGRIMNLRVRLRFKFNTNVNLTATNAYLGFVGGNPTQPTTADPFGTTGTTGVTFGINTGVATNFVVAHNAPPTSGATVVDNTGIAFDNNVHTVALVCDNANTRVSWSLDGGSYTHITTSIPASTNVLTPVAILETEEAVAKSFQLYEWFFQSDL